MDRQLGWLDCLDGQMITDQLLVGMVRSISIGRQVDCLQVGLFPSKQPLKAAPQRASISSFPSNSFVSLPSFTIVLWRRSLTATKRKIKKQTKKTRLQAGYSSGYLKKAPGLKAMDLPTWADYSKCLSPGTIYFLPMCAPRKTYLNNAAGRPSYLFSMLALGKSLFKCS